MPMLEAYGMTEASHQMTSNPLPPAAAAAGLGRGLRRGGRPDRRRRRPATSRPERPARSAIRGPGVTPGLPRTTTEANAEAFFDGWFRTGDQGAIEDGYLRLEGRLKEMIIRGGENISPHEIEDVLLAHPPVADAVAFGVADEKYGEEVAAAVVLRGEVSAEELPPRRPASAGGVQGARRDPRRSSEIPRTATGKVQRSRMPAHLDGANGEVRRRSARGRSAPTSAPRSPGRQPT